MSVLNFRPTQKRARVRERGEVCLYKKSPRKSHSIFSHNQAPPTAVKQQIICCEKPRNLFCATIVVDALCQVINFISSEIDNERQFPENRECGEGGGGGEGGATEIKSNKHFPLLLMFAFFWFCQEFWNSTSSTYLNGLHKIVCA